MCSSSSNSSVSEARGPGERARPLQVFVVVSLFQERAGTTRIVLRLPRPRDKFHTTVTSFICNALLYMLNAILYTCNALMNGAR